MTRQLVAGTVMVAVAAVALAAEPTERRRPRTNGVAEVVPGASVTSGRLLGVVTDAAGAPLSSTLVSASGPSGTALAVCGSDGRFEFRDLRPGTYLLRAHLSGYTLSERHVVEIKADLQTLESMRLLRTTADAESQAILTAGFGARGAALVGSQIDQAAALQPEAAPSPEVEGYAVAPHDHTEKAWRLRRARRSVLKDEAGTLAMARAGDAFVAEATVSALGTSASGVGTATDVLGGFPLSGQFRLLTRASFDSPAGLWSTDVLPGQVAFVALGAPAGEDGWGIQGAVTTGDSGSWVLAGSYVTRTSSAHSLELGLSYSRQRQPTGEPVGASLVPTSAELFDEHRREAGSVSARGSWVPSRRVTVAYGARLAGYGYLDDGRLFSPSAQVTVEPIDRTRVRVAVSQQMLAPGAEEFLPPSSGVWLPPERTFAPLSPADPLRAERARHVEVALERDIGHASVVGVRRFHQDVSDQMITMFGVKPYGSVPVADHYYLTNAAGVNVDGWGVSLRHAVGDRVHGAVAYTLNRAQWTPWIASGMSPRTVGVFRTGTERFHDVTTSVQTEIPETATRVFVVYRVNTAFARVEPEGLGAGLDGRFAFRVEQTLPFAPFGGSDWEVLVDVRSLFREQVAGASAYDELLVVSPPKQFIGGLVVHF